MNAYPLVSILINNHNYEQYLPQAIDSALNQTYPNIEVVVVDDGSSDSSKEIMLSYAERIVPVFKENGGQASALNKGFEACRGEIVLFLDSDDIFFSTKAQEIVSVITETSRLSDPAIISNCCSFINSEGITLADSENLLRGMLFAVLSRHISSFIKPSKITSLLANHRSSRNTAVSIEELCIPEMAYKFAHKYRFLPHLGLTTSCISMTRSMAEKVFPLPVSETSKAGADEFVVKASLLYGKSYMTSQRLSGYRTHDSNYWHGKRMDTKDRLLVWKELDEYLNSKLVHDGKQAVFCHTKSMAAKGIHMRHVDSRESFFKLISYLFGVVRWHLDTKTAFFFVNNFLSSSLLKIKYIF